MTFSRQSLFHSDSLSGPSIRLAHAFENLDNLGDALRPWVCTHCCLAARFRIEFERR